MGILIVNFIEASMRILIAWYELSYRKPRTRVGIMIAIVGLNYLPDFQIRAAGERIRLLRTPDRTVHGASGAFRETQGLGTVQAVFCLSREFFWNRF